MKSDPVGSPPHVWRKTSLVDSGGFLLGRMMHFPLAKNTGMWWGFNPRPRLGSDVTANVMRLLMQWFQSTPPCGERRRADRQDLRPKSFNPRPPCGERRGRGTERRGRTLVSIHAPVWGATWGFTRCKVALVFQSTPRMENDSNSRCPRQYKTWQSTPLAWEATIVVRRISSSTEFQSTPPAWKATG